MMQVTDKPTISDKNLNASLNRLAIPYNHILAMIVKIEGIPNQNENVQHGKELGVGSAITGPQTPAYNGTIVQSNGKLSM